jgi:hypothetical protein
VLNRDFATINAFNQGPKFAMKLSSDDGFVGALTELVEPCGALPRKCLFLLFIYYECVYQDGHKFTTDASIVDGAPPESSASIFAEKPRANTGHTKLPSFPEQGHEPKSSWPAK